MSTNTPAVPPAAHAPGSPLGRIRYDQASGLNPRVTLLAFGLFAVGTDGFVVAGLLPAIAKETGVSVSLAGQLVTLFSLTYGVSAPVLIALTGRWVPTRVLLIALSAFGLANVGTALAPTFPLLLLTRVLAGCLVAAQTSDLVMLDVGRSAASLAGCALRLWPRRRVCQYRATLFRNSASICSQSRQPASGWSISTMPIRL